MRLFSTEQVSKYHPDKYADQISDAILDTCLAGDPFSRVACETMVKGKTIILAGEITTKAKVNYGEVAQRVAKKLGYEVDNVCQYIETQSREIAEGITKGAELGAGDQGMMYGYATRETASRLPFGFDLANNIIKAIEDDRETNPDTPFQGDAKCQVTVDLDAPPYWESVKKILISVCHKPGALALARAHLLFILDGLGAPDDVDIIINPAGEWTVGGPLADCGLTGRKIVCDQYGGYCPVGGGAFSGKDPSKVDRSGAYMARVIAQDIIEKFPHVNTAEVQIAYAIGRSEPMSVCVKTDCGGSTDEHLSRWVKLNYDLTPSGIIKDLDLLTPQYEKLAEGCHYRIC